MSTEDNAPCPCGSEKALKQCCGPFLSQERLAPTAEQLMRSRFSAFALGAADYLISTLAPERRSPNERRMLEQELRQTQWVKLEIVETLAGRATDEPVWSNSTPILSRPPVLAVCMSALTFAKRAKSGSMLMARLRSANSDN